LSTIKPDQAHQVNLLFAKKKAINSIQSEASSLIGLIVGKSVTKACQQLGEQQIHFELVAVY
jgi:hypothetical protein